MTGTLEGTVTNGNGEPVEGADVQALNLGLGYTGSDTTDASGAYSITLEAADYQVIASHVTFSETISNVTVTDNQTTTQDVQISGLDPKVVGDHGDSVGVWGESTATSGSPIGVYGNVDSDTGYGVYSDGDAEVTGTLSAGRVDVDKVGLSAYRGSNQSIPTGSTETVVYDTVYFTDDFGGLDTGTGVYTIPADGVYHVDFQVTWGPGFSAGDTITYTLECGGGRGLTAEKVVPTKQVPVHSFSKTLYSINQGTSVEVTVEHDRGASIDVTGAGNRETWITIDKVG